MRFSDSLLMVEPSLKIFLFLSLENFLCVIIKVILIAENLRHTKDIKIN